MQSLASYLARPNSIEEEDRSSTIKVATWILLGVTVAFFFTRQVMKAIVFRKVALDDFFILAATVSAIGLSITVSMLASEGLGVSGALTLERATTLMQGYYASEFLYISAICFSKLSILVLFYTVVAVHRMHRRLMLAFGTFVMVWSIASLLVIAFQCELPRPWDVRTLRCFNMRVFWIVYCIVDMSTEVSIIMLSVNLVAYLQIRLSRKIAVVACFAPRALVVAASLVRLVWLYPITSHDVPEFRLWLPAVLAQLHVCLAVCTACVPYMVPFFKSLEGGLRRTRSLKTPEFRMDERRERTQSSLWFRRQQKTKTFYLWDTAAASGLQYERVPQASPQIPTPRALSPLTPPRYHSRPGTAKSNFSSRGGLSIKIPECNSPLPRSTEIQSPQTASSFALSPSCASPTPLIHLHSFVPDRKAPTPPLRTHSPYPPTASSRYSSRSPSPVSAGRLPRFSLYPQQTSSNDRYSPDLRNSGFTPISIPPIRALRSQKSNSISRHPNILLPTYVEQKRMLLQNNILQPKFSTAPYPTSPPSTTTSPSSKNRHLSVQDLNSPMGDAINHYFNSATLENTAPAPKPLPKPSPMPAPTPAAAPYSPQRRQRNQQVLSPTNTLRIQEELPTSPPQSRSRRNVSGDELFMSRDSIIMAKTSRSTKLPVVRDARSSPRLVVRNPT